MKTISTIIRPALCAAALALAMGAAPARADYRFEVLVPTAMQAGDSSAAIGINNSGQVLITTWDPTTGANDDYYVYDPGMQRYTALPQDPDAAPGINTLYNGFNDLGQMAGFELSTTHEIPAWAATLGWQPYQSFVYSSHVDNWDNFMPATPGAFVSEAVGINDEGVIVGINNTGTGDQGYMLADGKLKSIDAVATPTPTGSLPTGSTTDPAGLNNMGKIVGDFYDSKTPYKQQGFVYDVHTETFSRVNYHGNLYTEFNGVNDSGQIVGFTTNDPTESTAHGLFVDVNGEMSVVDYPGAVFTSNNGISNDGQIAGEYLDSNGIWHAFVATPIRNLRTPVRDNDR